MKMMKAIQIFGAEHAGLVDLLIPEPGPGQVLVKVKAVTTCPQWDLHIFFGKPMFTHQPAVPFPYPPGQPGHEMTGVIVKAGDDCTLKAGQYVSAWKDPGHTNPGCYAEYIVMNEEHLIPVPEHLPYQKVVSLELAMCMGSAILKLNNSERIKGKRCGVNGLGPAGLIALQMLLAEGAEDVVGIDPNPLRRQLALQLGASICVEPESDELGMRKKPGALDIAVDCAGYPHAVRSIMDRTNDAVALFAVQREDYILHHQGLSVIGYPGHNREAAEYALKLITEGKLDLSPLITCELTFDDYEKGVEMLQKQSAIKICFVPSSKE